MVEKETARSMQNPKTLKEGFRIKYPCKAGKSQPITAIIVSVFCKARDICMWAHLATPTLPRQPGEEEGHGGQVSSKIHVVPAHEEVANRQQALDQQQPRCVCITCIARSQNKCISWTFLHNPLALTSSWGYSLAQLLPMFFHTGRWTLWVSGLRHVH